MDNINQLINKNFPDLKFHYNSATYGGTIHAFYFHFNSEKELEQTWEALRNAIAVYFQSKLESEFGRWNLYIFFIIPQSIGKEVKHRIEHDIISSRKIVIDNHPKQNTKGFYDLVFSDHISNDNIKIDLKVKPVPKFSKNNVLGPLLNKLSIMKGKGKEETFLKALSELEKKLNK